MPLGPRRKNRKSDAKTLGALDLGAFWPKGRSPKRWVSVSAPLDETAAIE